MKSTVWFELPKALRDLAKPILPLSDVEYINILAEEAQKFAILFDELNVGQLESLTGFTYDQLKNIKAKLDNLNKERIDLICKCIKASIKVISKLMTYFEKAKQNDSMADNETLIQMKVLSKITRVIIHDANVEIKKSNNKNEKEFFNMIVVYIEKTQVKLYTLSTEMIGKYLEERNAPQEDNNKHQQRDINANDMIKINK